MIFVNGGNKLVRFVEHEIKSTKQEKQILFYGKSPIIGGSGYFFRFSEYVSLGTMICWTLFA